MWSAKKIKEIAQTKKNVVTPRQAKKTKWVARFLLENLTCDANDLIGYFMFYLPSEYFQILYHYVEMKCAFFFCKISFPLAI